MPKMRWALVQVLMPHLHPGHPDNQLPGEPDTPDIGLPVEPDYPDHELPEPGDPVDPDYGKPEGPPDIITPPVNLPVVPPGSNLILVRINGKWRWAVLPDVPVVTPTPPMVPTPPGTPTQPIASPTPQPKN